MSRHNVERHFPEQMLTCGKTVQVNAAPSVTMEPAERPVKADRVHSDGKGVHTAERDRAYPDGKLLVTEGSRKDIAVIG